MATNRINTGRAHQRRQRSILCPFACSIFIPLIIASCSVQKPHILTDPLSPTISEARKDGIEKALALTNKDLKSQSGIYTLENGGRSFFSRVWFMQHAQKSIDIQYYSIAKDITGRIACDELIRAADEGVKVRIIIDDAATKMRSREVELLDSHENIEIRVYNAGLMLGRVDRRIAKLTGNYNRMLRRMHNKIIVFDDEVCITGGRNIADEYFDYDDEFNFRDRDLLMIGKGLTEAKKSFEKFWNDSLTVPYSKISGKYINKNDPSRFSKLHEEAAKYYSNEIRKRIDKFPDELRNAEKNKELIWVKQAVYISDKPGKNEDKESRKGGICTDSLTDLIRNAKSTLDIQSPYFITTDISKQLIKDAVQRGVKVRFLTNSLASIDNIEAYSGYKKDRETILDMGVQLYEFKPDSKERFELMVPDVMAPLRYKPVYGLHSKTMIIDSAVCIIGSYNFDPRSANYNTECISVIRSQEVAGNLYKYINEEFKSENSWAISKDYNPEAEAGIKKRIKAAIKMLIPKKLL